MYELGILVGFKCNFSCDHCITSSSSTRAESLSEYEIKLITDEVSTNVKLINKIIFSGGEPTLEIGKMEQITKELISRNILISNAIVSNGSFLFSSTLTNRVLNLPNLKHINLSIDEFHVENKVIPLEKILELKNALSLKGISLEVSTVLGSPLGYHFVETFKDKGIQVSLSKLSYAGRARNSKNNMIPRRVHSFDDKEKCKFLDHIVYVPKRGFTSCMKNLTWNSTEFDSYIFQSSINDLLNSKFYKKILQLDVTNMKSILDKKETFNSICDLCEFYHKELLFGNTVE